MVTAAGSAWPGRRGFARVAASAAGAGGLDGQRGAPGAGADDGYVGHEQEPGRTLFFEKKNQKTFIRWGGRTGCAAHSSE